MVSRSPPIPDPLWIFGYGSLVWRPAFEHVERRAAFIRGFARRFWQGSTDHRGLPGRPGRVATLIREAGAVCWGTAYRVAPERADEVLARLDDRERGGFVRHVVEVRLPADGPGSGPGSRVDALLYWATPENPNYLGPASLEAIAEQIHASQGPSGHNVESGTDLARARGAMGARDDHVDTLVRLVHARRERIGS